MESKGLPVKDTSRNVSRGISHNLEVEINADVLDSDLIL